MINKQDKEGNTALHNAIEAGGLPQNIAALIDNGADLFIVNGKDISSFVFLCQLLVKQVENNNKLIQEDVYFERQIEKQIDIFRFLAKKNKANLLTYYRRKLMLDESSTHLKALYLQCSALFSLKQLLQAEHEFNFDKYPHVLGKNSKNEGEALSLNHLTSEDIFSTFYIEKLLRYEKENDYVRSEKEVESLFEHKSPKEQALQKDRDAVADLIASIDKCVGTLKEKAIIQTRIMIVASLLVGFSLAVGGSVGLVAVLMSSAEGLAPAMLGLLSTFAAVGGLMLSFLGVSPFMPGDDRLLEFRFSPDEWQASIQKLRQLLSTTNLPIRPEMLAELEKEITALELNKPMRGKKVFPSFAKINTILTVLQDKLDLTQTPFSAVPAEKQPEDIVIKLTANSSAFRYQSQIINDSDDDNDSVPLLEVVVDDRERSPRLAF